MRPNSRSQPIERTIFEQIHLTKNVHNYKLKKKFGLINFPGFFVYFESLLNGEFVRSQIVFRNIYFNIQSICEGLNKIHILR